MEYNKIQCGDLCRNSYDTYLIDKICGKGTSEFFRENDVRLDAISKEIKQIRGDKTVLSEEESIRMKELIDEMHNLNNIVRQRFIEILS